MNHETKTIYIRVDGNERIATGHIMRCLSIAVQLKKMNCKVVFLVSDDQPTEFIRSNGFQYDILGSKWNDLDHETDILCNYIHAHNIKVLLIDSYQVTISYLAALSELVNIVYIDDLIRFPYPVHTLINYSIWVTQMDYMKTYQAPILHIQAGTKSSTPPSLPFFLLGGSYIPLREEFQATPRIIHPAISNILMTMGGTDHYNVLGKLLKLIFDSDHTDISKKSSQSKSFVSLSELNYHIIVGAFNQHKAELYALASLYPNIYLHENISNMSYYMRLCDIAISAGGSTLYELCACGTPTICMEIADNQTGAQNWEKNNYMLYAGNISFDENTCLLHCLDHILTYKNHYELRKTHSKRLQTLVDGQGAKRIAAYLYQLLEN